MTQHRQQRAFGCDSFKLPLALLTLVQRLCAKHDCTRSQFYRHAIRGMLKKHGELKDDDDKGINNNKNKEN